MPQVSESNLQPRQKVSEERPYLSKDYWVARAQGAEVIISDQPVEEDFSNTLIGPKLFWPKQASTLLKKATQIYKTDLLFNRDSVHFYILPDEARAHTRAEKLLVRAVKILEQEPGAKDPLTIEARRTLARHYSLLFKYDQSVSEFDKCIAACEYNYGKASLAVANILADKVIDLRNAVVIRNLRYNNETDPDKDKLCLQAEKIIERIFDIRDKHLGDTFAPIQEHEWASVANKLAWFYEVRGQNDQAEKWYLTSLAMFDLAGFQEDTARFDALRSLSRLSARKYGWKSVMEQFWHKLGWPKEYTDAIYNEPWQSLKRQPQKLALNDLKLPEPPS